MPSSSLNINQIEIDHEFYVWGSGEDIRGFNGKGWDYYNYSNSAVPSDPAGSYALDTRCISIDPEQYLWCGVAQGPTAGYNNVAVFSLNTNDVIEGRSWEFSDLGNFNGVYQEISTIYACPYGDDILAFATPLNGIGGTAGLTNYTRIYGVTGGRLFYYLKETEEWKETIPGYTWPHIYDIKAKGVDGVDYFYYVATEEGLLTIPQGTLSTVTLTDGTEIIRQAQVYNTHTSGIISDRIYSIDLDETGNLWIGTDLGLSYFDGHSFWNYGTTGPVTLVKSRDHGHVFYSMGDGELNQGTGIWHFNGTTHTQFTSSNSSLSSNDVLGIKLVGHNIDQDGLIVRENSLWILEYNYLTSFEYDIPHVYGSSKYAGATGWNFIYYSPTGGTGAPLPRTGKYSWTYPEWRVYQDEYLQFKHPGLDPDALFLTTSLKAIADGEAGKQAYWDNYPLPSYDQEIASEKITSPAWSDIISFIRGTSGSTNGGVTINSSTTLKIGGSNKLYVGGFVSGNIETHLGYYSDSTSATFINSNPTLAGNAASPDTSASDFVDCGFVACYDESGAVESVITFPGYSTNVTSISPSTDGNSITVTGRYNWLIENGEYIYSGWESAVSTFNNGPTGAPIGITNANVPGATTGTYPWLYGPTGATGYNPLQSIFATGGIDYAFAPGGTAAIPGDCDFNTVNTTPSVYSAIDQIRLNFFDINSTNWEMSLFVPLIYTGYVITVQDRNTPQNVAYYVINSIEINETADVFNSAPTTVIFGVTYQAGSGSTTIGTDLRFNFYSYSNYCFPLAPALQDVANTISGGQSAIGVFVAQIEKDLGDITSFTGLTGDYNSEIRKRYKVTNFRTFPSSDLSFSNSISDLHSISDTTDYSVNLSIFSDSSSFFSTSNGYLSTLKNKWGRSNDADWTNETLKDSSLYKFMSYVRLSNEDFSLQATSNSTGLTSGAVRYEVGSIDSLSTDNTTLLTGMTRTGFNFGGINLVAPDTSSDYPFFIILDNFGSGITGGIITGALPQAYGEYVIRSSKSDSTYYITTAYGPSGSYFGNSFYGGGTGTYLLTAEITEQGVTKNIFAPYLDGLTQSAAQPRFYEMVKSKILPNDQYFILYTVSTGLGYKEFHLLKSDQDGRILDDQYWNGDTSVTYDLITATNDEDSNIYVASSLMSYGASGPYVTTQPDNGFVLKSEQYVPELGINLGNIISRPGSGAWTWCDVHSSDSHLEIPLMSTVVFNNYASNIYGKKNNKWSLIDESNGNDLLTIKSSPYFIYTFTSTGYYSITNEVEDSEGNVYEVSKPGFIKVINHKDKRPDDRHPNSVDSTDFGYPEPPDISRDYEVKKLQREMEQQELELFKAEQPPFGSSLAIPDDPDATFSTQEI